MNYIFNISDAVEISIESDGKDNCIISIEMMPDNKIMQIKEKCFPNICTENGKLILYFD